MPDSKPTQIQIDHPELAALWRPLSRESEAALIDWAAPWVEDMGNARENSELFWGSGVAGRSFDWRTAIEASFGRPFYDIECQNAGYWLDAQFDARGALKRIMGKSFGVVTARGRQRRVHAIEIDSCMIATLGGQRWLFRPLDEATNQAFSAEIASVHSRLGHAGLSELDPRSLPAPVLEPLRRFFCAVSVALASESDIAMESFQKCAPILGGLAATALGKKTATEEAAALEHQLAQAARAARKASSDDTLGPAAFAPQAERSVLADPDISASTRPKSRL
jgi:hypothetical protein